MTIDFDLILPDVGEYGNYQKLMVWFVFLPGMIPCGFHAYNQLFMATQPKFRCLIPDLDLADRNFTEELIRNARYFQNIHFHFLFSRFVFACKTKIATS